MMHDRSLIKAPHWSLIAAILILCNSIVDGQGQFGRFQLSGIVTDPAGERLPGAEIKVGRSGPVVVTDARGAFEVPNLPAGVYSVEAGLQGFRTQTLRVTLPQPPATPLRFVLRIGLLSHPHYVLLSPGEAVRSATAIARVRLDGLAPPVACNDLIVISALHNATVVDVWKGELPEKIQIFETEAGSCIEEDLSVAQYGREASYYENGAEYIVLLTGSAPRFGGLGDGSHVFPIRGEIVHTDGFAGLGETSSLREFQLKLRELSR